jgi:hypothetical protein
MSSSSRPPIAASGASRFLSNTSAASRRRTVDEVQLCRQALCLEEIFATPVPKGALFYRALAAKMRRLRTTIYVTSEALAAQRRRKPRSDHDQLSPDLAEDLYWRPGRSGSATKRASVCWWRGRSAKREELRHPFLDETMRLGSSCMTGAIARPHAALRSGQLSRLYLALACCSSHVP